jgi:hypothetical protein
MKIYLGLYLTIYVPYGPPWTPSQAFLNSHSLPARRNWQLRSVALGPQRKQREGRGYDTLRAAKLGPRQHVSHTPAGPRRTPRGKSFFDVSAMRPVAAIYAAL